MTTPAVAAASFCGTTIVLHIVSIIVAAWRCRPRPVADGPPMTSMNKVFADLPVTIFEAMSQAARDNNAINLGQGFPDDPGPEDIRRAAADATMNGYNQYPSMMGIPELRQAIATHYGH